jgi:hypothetical protein
MTFFPVGEGLLAVGKKAFGRIGPNVYFLHSDPKLGLYYAILSHTYECYRRAPHVFGSASLSASATWATQQDTRVLERLFFHPVLYNAARYINMAERDMFDVASITVSATDGYSTSRNHLLGMQNNTGSRGVLRREAKTTTCAVLSACHVVFEGVTSDYRRWIC